jgi:hypothetical protein
MCPACRRPAFVAVLLVGTVLVTTAGRAADLRDGFDDEAAAMDRRWSVAESDALPQVLRQERSRESPHAGPACERLVLENGRGTVLRLDYPIGPAALIDELQGSVWVRAQRPDVRLAVRVVLPRSVSRVTGRPVETLLVGDRTRDVDRWECLEVGRLPAALAGQLPALRLEHGPDTDPAGAVATHLVLDLDGSPGRHEIAIDELRVAGCVAVGSADAAARPRQVDPAVVPVSTVAPVPADPPAGLTRGVIEVGGLPFFPRSIEHNGEPLATLAELGFNCVQLPVPATADLLSEARRVGLWVICPPPPIPDIDVRDPDALPALRHWDRVLMWDLGTGLSTVDLETVAERGRRLRACDLRAGRPLIAGVDAGLRDLSRHVDLLVARRTVLGTSLEFVDYLQWLRQRTLLARPGTPFLASLATEIDPRAAAQAAALAGVGARDVLIDPESLLLAAQATVAAGARGILFTSSARLDGDGRGSQRRAAAVRAMNLRMRLLEPWGAAGRFAANATTSDPEVQAVVVEASRARVVLAWRGVQGAQIAARRYGGGDLPRDDAPLTLLVPGVPEAHQAWELAPGGLRPLRQRRVTGGVSVTLDSFLASTAVLFSGDAAITGHMQERVRDIGPQELASWRGLAALGLADTADLLGRLPAQAFSGPPPVAAAQMLSTANTLAAEGEVLVAANPAAAVERYRRSAAITGQFQRRIWENGVRADGSMVASPLASSVATVAEQWAFVGARQAATPGPELLVGGGMERIEDLAASGWRHFAHPAPGVGTAVEIAQAGPASGSGCLRLVVTPEDPQSPPAAIETPPVWVTTPPLTVPTGKLVEITAQVRVTAPITASVDGLLVFDSLAGPALAERVGPTGSWRRLVLQRIATADAEPLVVTFALTGVGAAEIDDVSVRTIEREPLGGLVAAPPTVPAAAAFPRPADLLAPAPPRPAPPAAPPAATTAWPGSTLEWPRRAPWTSPTAPPPGPGGGTIDPFKRARSAPPPG